MDQQPPMPPIPGGSLFEMEINADAQRHLRAVSKWGKFIGITLLVLLIIMVLAVAASFQSVVEQFNTLVPAMKDSFGIGLAVIAVVLLFGFLWTILLLRGSSKIQQGLAAQDVVRLSEGFQALKNLFVLSIVVSALAILYSLLAFLNR